MASVMRYRYGPKADLQIQKTGIVSIEMGDMVKVVGTNGRVRAVSAVTDSTSLIGVAMTASPATDPTATKILVRTIGVGTVFEMKLSAAGLLKTNQPLRISAAQTLVIYGTAGTNLNSSSTSVVAIVAEAMKATGSTCLVRFLGTKYDAQIINTG